MRRLQLAVAEQVDAAVADVDVGELVVLGAGDGDERRAHAAEVGVVARRRRRWRRWRRRPRRARPSCGRRHGDEGLAQGLRRRAADATSPARWPPMPSATAHSPASSATSGVSSLTCRTRPTSVATAGPELGHRQRASSVGAADLEAVAAAEDDGGADLGPVHVGAVRRAEVLDAAHRPRACGRRGRAGSRRRCRRGWRWRSRRPARR